MRREHFRAMGTTISLLLPAPQATGRPAPCAHCSRTGRTRTAASALRASALATPGMARRRWRQGAHEHHHLLNPRMGKPARNVLSSASVGAARCVQAEVAAKVACVLGLEASAVFLHAHGLAGLLMHQSGA